MKIQDASKMTKRSYVLTKTTMLAEVLNESPRAAELLSMYGLHCVSCYMNVYDTLETGAQLHGMTDEDIDIMIAEINDQLQKEKKDEK